GLFDNSQFDLRQRFRLHLGGLSSSVTAEDIETRFSLFGTVEKVDGVGKLDENGYPLNYGFVDIISTQPQIKRCMNLLSGSIFKGNVLRIAPARPDFRARMEREKAGLPQNTFTDPDEEALRAQEEKILRKRQLKLARWRARRKGIDGYESANMELMTSKRFKSREGINGWKKDPETSLPIFPLITRPLHPLRPMELTGKNLTENDRLVPARPPNRARRARIDPTVYRAAIKNRKTHLLGPRAISIEQYRLGFVGGAKDIKNSQGNRPFWACDYANDGEVIWKLQNGMDGPRQEKVRLSESTLKKVKESQPSCFSQSSNSFSPVPQFLREYYSPSNILSKLNSTPNRNESAVGDNMDVFKVVEDSQSIGLRQEKPTSDDNLGSLGKNSHTSNKNSLPAFLDSNSAIEQFNTDLNLSGVYTTHACAPNSPLRLKGGAPSKRLHHPAGKDKACERESAAFQSNPDAPSSIDQELSAQLKLERQKYVSLASQLISQTVDNAVALEDVGQGSQDAVKRQKAKERKQWQMRSHQLNGEPTEVAGAVKAHSHNHYEGEPDVALACRDGDIISKDSLASQKTSKKKVAVISNPGSDHNLSNSFQSIAAQSEALAKRSQLQVTLLSESNDSRPASAKYVKQLLQNEVDGARNNFNVEPSEMCGPPQKTRTNVDIRSNTNDKMNEIPSLTKHGYDIQMSNLTDMFKAKEAEKVEFRLSDNLGEFELEDNNPLTCDMDKKTDVDVSNLKPDLNKQLRSQTSIHPSRLMGEESGLMKLTAQPNDDGLRTPFFVFPMDDDPESRAIWSLLSPEHQARVQQQCLRPAASSLGWRTFFRTESMDEIQEEHNAKKAEWTEQMRRKHKEAIKKSRKWGNKQIRKPPTLEANIEAENDQH
ncbi:hypothetical protein O181_028748, partial [Austropuccinia psidii MF-1]|nr:hypothetical protein [Austropuccinia psidii MF-1]